MSLIKMTQCTYLIFSISAARSPQLDTFVDPRAAASDAVPGGRRAQKSRFRRPPECFARGRRFYGL
jgi:hypothetical protein